MRQYSITKALNIPEYKITKIISVAEKGIHMRIEPYKRPPAVCSGCGCVHLGLARGETEVIAEDYRIVNKQDKGIGSENCEKMKFNNSDLRTIEGQWVLMHVEG